MASGPLRRRRGARIGVAVAIAAALAVSLCLLQSSDEPVRAAGDVGLGVIRADGRLVLRVFAPKLY